MGSPYGDAPRLARPSYSSRYMPPAADSFAAVLFDLDGVLTPTADIHTRAWTEMFDEFLVPRGLPPFTDDDYLRYVDGKPRFDGVRSFLAFARHRAARRRPRRSAEPGLRRRPRQPQERPLPGDPAARRHRPVRGLVALPRPPRHEGHEDRRGVLVAQRPGGPRRLRAGPAVRGRHRRHGGRAGAHRRQAGAGHVPERRPRASASPRPTRSWSRTPCPASRPGAPATSASSSASTAAPVRPRSASTARTSSSTTSRSCCREVPGARAPRAQPLPARSRGGSSRRSTTRATSA